MAINLHAYKKPSLPSPLSPFPSPDCAARPSRFLVGGPLICRLPGTFPTSTVNQTLPLLAHPHSLVCAHLLTPSVRVSLQQIKHGIVNPKPPQRSRAPADPRSHYWTQSTTPTKFSNPPCLPDHRRDIAAIQNSPEHRRSSTSARPRRILRRKPSRPGEHLP
jgi:hypothetical protein